MNELKLTRDIKTGGLSSIVISDDAHEMNWCESQSASWGVPYHNAQVAFNRFDPLVLCDFTRDRSVYKNAFVSVEVVRVKNTDGSLTEEYTVTNVSSLPVFIGKGELGIFTPFNDSYESSDVCLTNHCHAHVFSGGKTAWVCALRMGESDLNLGLILKEGEIDCYRQWLPPYAKNDRGDLMLCPAPLDLAPGGSYRFSWDVVVHKGKENFINKLSKYHNQLFARVKFETVFEGEDIEIGLDYNEKHSDKRIDAVVTNAAKIRADGNNVIVTPDRLGETGICCSVGDASTSIDCFVSPKLDELVANRVERICFDQQYICEGHPLDGAYLIYDNESGTKYFSGTVADHNASRERIGMGILVAKFLQRADKYDNADPDQISEIDASLKKYETFVLREFVDPETGDVFDTVGRDPTQIRLYNAPWVCVFMCELYKLRGESRYLEIASRVMRKYYEGGGDHFYPNAFTPSEPVCLMREAEMHAEADELLDAVLRHANNVIANGTSYPKHEVDYEQTIVAPALTFLLDAYELTKDKSYLDEAAAHLRLLERFNGFQPDYRLDEVAIRHWDDYWFGKSATFGDTFPHYWSVLSGWCFYLWYKATGNEEYRHKAEKSARNCLCLFKPDGTASCAYVYPYMINDKRGEFYDAWANDQDFALYFALKILKGE